MNRLKKLSKANEYQIGQEIDMNKLIKPDRQGDREEAVVYFDGEILTGELHYDAMRDYVLENCGGYENVEAFNQYQRKIDNGDKVYAHKFLDDDGEVFIVVDNYSSDKSLIGEAIEAMKYHFQCPVFSAGRDMSNLTRTAKNNYYLMTKIHYKQ